VSYSSRIFALVCLAALPLIANDRWIRIRSGPFEVMSAVGERPAREFVLEAEQFRWAFSQLTGVDDPVTVWPIRVVILRKGGALTPGGIIMARDAWISSAIAGQGPTPEWKKACARILLNDNTGRMPRSIEEGLISLLSTLEVKGVRLTLGAPPPPEERTRDWARLHFFTTTPEYARRSRVFLANLARGAEYEIACRNAFEKSASEMDKLVDGYIAAGKFEAVPFSGRPLNVDDFTVRNAESYDGSVAMADLLLADPKRALEAEAAYKALTGPEATEGQALLAARRNDPATAEKLFAAAFAAGSKSPRAMLGSGTKEGAVRAIETNPKWPDPHVRLAELAEAPNVKAAEMGKAAALAPRDPELWKAAALAYTENNQYADASKAWSAAERAAESEEARAAIREARMDNDRRRAEWEAAERKRIADAEAAALDKLRNDSLAEIRAAEAKANKEMQKDGPVPTNVQPWWDGPDGPVEKIAGKLQRVDCLAGGRARVVIQTGAKAPLQLLIRDPQKIVLSGAGELSLGCGPQRPAREVAVEFAPGRDARSATRGEIRVIEFK
jgi:hypothetical protein